MAGTPATRTNPRALQKRAQQLVYFEVWELEFPICSDCGGRVGICLQKVSEAEAMAAGVYVSNEVIASRKLMRLAYLVSRLGSRSLSTAPKA